MAQDAPRDHSEVFGILRRGAAEFPREELADFAARQVHRWKDNVIRSLFAELNDELAQIGLDHLKAGLLERFVQVNLLGGHGLGFDNRARLFFADDAKDDVARLLAGAGPMNSCATRFQFVGEIDQIFVEMVDRFPFSFGGGLPSGLPVLK